MKQLPTAEEFYDESSKSTTSKHTVEDLMIEFAKLHVQAALESAAEKAGVNWDGAGADLDAFVNKESILNAYNLDNIK